ncbi:nucleoside-diphosphate-sugar epimerase [Kribbella amoyensis]|uniref:Nucleoside-diphosphate-sugar epimerase n=1 Tax=Kribbella amoyensis TaxID=996641 RepID=A0A561BJW9_9ACTN|nr:NAD-dependent epimerase/dehydratase family protein [Kribbella amoyensis]TWD79140.1 nucleoside-diphosphate-sugar epimerase [Kribbella amoyensis]
MSRVFVAGATGVVGRNLVPLLLAAGHQVTGLTRRASDGETLRRLGAEAAVADVYDATPLAEVVAAAKPDVVMHQLTDLGGGDFQANSRIREVGTRNLVDAALAAEVGRVIVQSIAWVYEPGDSPATEDTPLDLEASSEARARTVGAVATMEGIVAEVPESVVLRYGLLYGPGTWYREGGWMDEQVRDGRLKPTADISSFLHVADAASAAVAALIWPTGVVNIVDDEPAPASEWVPVFANSVGAVSDRPGAAAGTRNGWARGADNTRARELGWRPVHRSWREGFFGG